MGRTRIIIVLAIAAIGAVCLMLVVGAMTKHKPTPVVAAAPPAQPMAKVLVAKHDLAVGTRVGPNDIAWQDWPAAAVNPAFITDGKGARTAPTDATAALAAQANQTVQTAATMVSGGDKAMEQVYGSIVRQAILANEPVTNAKIVRGGEGSYMAVILQPGMRAVSVPIAVATAAGGFILPGDRVDVVHSHPDQTSAGSAPVAEVLLRNIRVLAIDQNSLAPKNGVQSQVGATATLEVAAADTELVARAKTQGEIVLALRPYTDSPGPSGRVDTGDQGRVQIYRGGTQAAEVVTIQ